MPAWRINAGPSLVLRNPTPLDHDRGPQSPLDEYRLGRPCLYAAGMAGDMPCGICGPLRFGLVGDAWGGGWFLALVVPEMPA